MDGGGGRGRGMQGRGRGRGRGGRFGGDRYSGNNNNSMPDNIPYEKGGGDRGRGRGPRNNRGGSQNDRLPQRGSAGKSENSRPVGDRR